MAARGALAGYLLLMLTSPVKIALLDGWRAIRRYHVLWITFGAFGFANILFQLTIRIYSYCVLPAGDRPVFMWLRAAWRDPKFWLTGSPESLWYVPPGGLHEAARDAILPAVEGVAGIFNNLVSTFPLAAVAAVLLLVNWDGHQMVLQRALRRRYKLWGWGAYAAILVGAFAVIAKILLYAAPPLLHFEGSLALLWFQWSPVVVWIAFLFEYFFGVCIQIYLILLAYCWVRGLTFDHAKLLDFAIRRFAFVVKWAAVVVVLSSLFLDLPLILKNFAPFQEFLAVDEATMEFRIRLARSILAGFLLIFSTMQITLTFHNESIVNGLRDHATFLQRHWWRFGWFLIIAALHFYLFTALNLVLSRALGEGTAPGILWSFLAPWLNGIVGAWLLASWVCVFRNCDHARSRTRIGSSSSVNPDTTSGLEVRALVCERGPLALQVEHAAFARGTFHLLLGAADSGNDLLLRLLGLLEAPDGGEIRLEGSVVQPQDNEARLKLRERRLGFVFAAPFLLPAFSVIENVAMPLFKISSLEIEQARERSEVVMEFAGLCELSQTPCGELPAFAQHRVALARALVNEPAALLVENLDSTLDGEDLRLFSILLRQAAAQFNVAVIASASPDFSAEPNDRVFEVAEGAISCPPLPKPAA